MDSVSPGSGSTPLETHRRDRLAALAPYGKALADYHAGATSATLVLHSSLGEHEEFPVGVFFRTPDEFFAFERYALELCRGRVLDAGAGTGVHSLELMARGFDVTAIDIVPEAVQVMRDRGVVQVREADMFELSGQTYDTILMLMNGTGPVETLQGLDRFLRHARRLLAPGGQLLVDSAEVSPVEVEHSSETVSITWPDEPAGPDAYPGEAWIRLEYDGDVAPPFRELYVGARVLQQRAAAAGWTCHLAFEGKHDSYLARLVPIDDRPDGANRTPGERSHDG
jgi:SAM-dependent methyltransferase